MSTRAGSRSHEVTGVMLCFEVLICSHTPTHTHAQTRTHTRSTRLLDLLMNQLN